MAGRETAVIVDTFKQPVDKLCYFLVFDNTAKTTDFDIVNGADPAPIKFTNQPSIGPYRPISQYLKDIYGNYATPYFKATTPVSDADAKTNLATNENVYRINVDGSTGLSVNKFTGFNGSADPGGDDLSTRFALDDTYFDNIFRDGSVTQIIQPAGSEKVTTLPTIVIKEGEGLKIFTTVGGSSLSATIIAKDPTDENTQLTPAAEVSTVQGFHRLDPGTFYYYVHNSAPTPGNPDMYSADQPTHDNIIFGKIIVTAQAAKNQSRVPLFGPMDRLKPGKSYSGRNSMALYIDEGGKDEFGSGSYAKALRPLFADTGASSELPSSYHDVYYSCLRSTASGASPANDLISIPELTKKIIDGDFTSIYLQPDFTSAETGSVSNPFTNAFRKTDATVDGMKIFPKAISGSEVEVDIEQADQSNDKHFSKLFLGQEFTAMSSAGIQKTYTYGVGTETLPLQLVPAFATAHDTDTDKYVSRIQAVGGGFFTYKSNETCPVFCMNVPKDFAVMSWEFEYKQYGPGSSQSPPTASYKFVNWGDATDNVVFDEVSNTGAPDYFRGLNLESPPLINFLHVGM